MRILKYHPVWMSMEPLCKRVCLCAHCNECISIGRDWIIPLETLDEDAIECLSWVLWVSCSPIERGCWPIQLNMSVSVSVSLSLLSLYYYFYCILSLPIFYVALLTDAVNIASPDCRRSVRWPIRLQPFGFLILKRQRTVPARNLRRLAAEPQIPFNIIL